jgi:hypothetical protein
MLRLDSANLDGAIHHTIHEVNDDTLQTLVRKFYIVDMSARNRGKEPLIGEEFVIDVCGVSRATLKKNNQPQKHYGSGKRKIQPKLPHINLNSLMVIDNDDGLCLFMAVNLLRAKSMMNRQQFSVYYRNTELQIPEIRQMVRWIKAPRCESYAIEDYG